MTTTKRTIIWVAVVTSLACACVAFAANQKKTSSKKSRVTTIPININVETGAANPRHKHASIGDTIKFTADKDCTVDFHHSIFDIDHVDLKQGTPTSLTVTHTNQMDYCVEGAPCPPAAKGRGKGLGSDPNDITVP